MTGTLDETEDEVIAGTLTLARELLGMDAAHVSDFTERTQRFRRVEGDTASFDLHEGDELPLEETYCVRMADGRIPNVVPDTSQEPEVAGLPVTKAAGLGAYVGVPIVAASGELLGSFCCLSHEPDPSLADRDIRFLHVLAKLVADRIERQRLEAERRAELEREVARRTAELRETVAQLAHAQAETARRLSMAVEYRDDQTGAHIERVGRMSAALARAAGMDERFCATIALAAPLHDVGKVAAPDAVLLKHGRLDEDERALIERHAETGYRILEGSSSEVLRMAATIALTHHERVDGQGYTRRLAGREIPVEGRIVAIVDVFDALTTDRVYRAALPVAEALEVMRGDVGHFDPELLEVFIRDVANAL